MKRFQLLVLVAAITAAAIWWQFYRSRHTSSAAVAALLPKDTLVFLHLPDFNRSRAEFQRTDLYQIWLEPEVQEFLQKPRSKVAEEDGLRSVADDCASLQMKDAFLALTDIQYSAWKMVGGFRFKGDPDNAMRIVAKWKASLLRKNDTEPSKPEILKHQAHQIEVNTAGFFRLATVRSGEWIFWANDPEQLKPLLDRLDHPIKDSGGVLADDDLYGAASKRIPSIYTGCGFVRVAALAEKLRSADEDDEDNKFEALQTIQSLSVATSFDGGRIREITFIKMPKLPETNTLTRASLPVATKDSFLFLAGVLNVTKPGLPNSPAALGWMSGLQKIISTLSSSEVTSENWESAFGSEISWIGNWPSNAHLPSLVATLPVKDSAKANAILNQITTAFPDSPPWEHHEKNGIQYYSTETGGLFFSFSPTIGVSDRMMVAGANEEVVEAGLKRIADANSELAATRNFRAAERAIPTPQEMFVYIDPALIYTRLDAAIRPWLFMTAASLPRISDSVDLTKLPTADVVTRHLSPIVMSQRYDGEGYISESVGPITVGHAILGIGGLWVGGAGLLPNFSGKSPGYLDRPHRFAVPLRHCHSLMIFFLLDLRPIRSHKATILIGEICCGLTEM